jgi:hypothetical protein
VIWDESSRSGHGGFDLLAFLDRHKEQLIWIVGSFGFTGIWVAFLYFFQPGTIGLLATAFATACLIALIQAHYKKTN